MILSQTNSPGDPARTPHGEVGECWPYRRCYNRYGTVYPSVIPSTGGVARNSKHLSRPKQQHQANRRAHNGRGSPLLGHLLSLVEGGQYALLD